MCKDNHGYTGHGANTGGLQQHSISDAYLQYHPWIKIVTGNLDVIEHRAYNTLTGQLGPIRSTYEEAIADCVEYSYRAKIVAAVHARGGLRNWADINNDPQHVTAHYDAAVVQAVGVAGTRQQIVGRAQ